MITSIQNITIMYIQPCTISHINNPGIKQCKYSQELHHDVTGNRGNTIPSFPQTCGVHSPDASQSQQRWSCYICSCIICENHWVCVYGNMSMREERWREGERYTHLQQSVLEPLFASHTPPPLLFFPLISPSCHLAGSGSRMRYWKDMLYINMQPHGGMCTFTGDVETHQTLIQGTLYYENVV